MTNLSRSDINHIRGYAGVKDGRSVASFRGNCFNTALQPVFSFAHKRIVGYEALLRGQNPLGQNINFDELLSPEQDEASLILIDRLCRYIHVQNFMTLGDPVNWLFLNVCPQVIINGKRYGAFFSDLLATFELPSHRVVIEIVEHPISDQDLLSEKVEYYKDIGCLVAIDDFGAGYSNFERIWSLSPDIVKLDRSMIVRASKQSKIRQMLHGIVSLLHQAGCLVLVEGVETEEQTMIAMDCEADFVQGYFFAKPTTVFNFLCNTLPPFESLFEKYNQMVMVREKTTGRTYKHYHRLYHKAAKAIQEGASLAAACAELISDPSAIRCYLLLPNGIQIGKTILSETYDKKCDIRFGPIQDVGSSDWSRRHYLKRAIAHPNHLHISRPYLSMTGLHTCITLSMMFSTGFGTRVFCCDLNWD